MREVDLYKFLEHFAKGSYQATKTPTANFTSYVGKHVQALSSEIHDALKRCTVCRLKFYPSKLVGGKCKHCQGGHHETA